MTDRINKALFVSQRNSEEQNASLIHQTGCRLFFHSIELTKAALRIQGETAVGALQLVAVPEFDEWVKSYTTPFPYRKLFEDARYDPILVLHSSGSTGKQELSDKYSTPTISDYSYQAHLNRSP